jgi:tetratricopeptide (TPR) repeat protein
MDTLPSPSLNLHAAQLLYERGNDQFRSGDYEGALKSYSQCIDGYKTDIDCSIDAEFAEATKESDYFLKAISNRALCHGNMRNYEVNSC